MPRTISFRVLLAALLAAHLLSAPPLWGHLSDAAAVLGRYSSRYALVLGLHSALTLLNILALAFAPRLHGPLSRLAGPVLWGLYAGAALGVLALWSLSLEAHVLAYLSVVTLAAVVLTAHAAEAAPVLAWRVVAVGAVALMAVPLVTSALTAQGFHPDEAHYTDYASTFIAEGMLYDSAWLETPYVIEPGWPWALAAYGWLLEVFGYTVYVGRVVNLAAYLLCFAGLYAVGLRLYSRAAGLLAAVTATLSIAFIPEWDYSPNHLLTIVGAWSLWLWLVAGAAARPVVRRGLLAAVGLVVTASLNVHAAGVVFALAYTLWSAFNLAWAVWQRREPRRALADALAFGGGALAGTIAYILTNILPVGGLGVYLGVLGEWDGARRNPLFFYTWESLAERLLILAAVVWLAWRRTPADRTLLSAVGFTTLAAVLADTQGYIWHFGPYYFLALGAFLSEWTPRPALRSVAAAGVVVVLGAQVGGLFVDWRATAQFARTGTVPTYLFNDLKAVVPPYIRPDDVVYTTHQLIWLYPHTRPPRIVTYGAELKGMARYGLDDPVAVWEVVQPTAIVFVEGQMNFDPGMVAYMARHPFEVCAEHRVQETTITIYRRDCAAVNTPARPSVGILMRHFFSFSEYLTR